MSEKRITITKAELLLIAFTISLLIRDLAADFGVPTTEFHLELGASAVKTVFDNWREAGTNTVESLSKKPQ